MATSNDIRKGTALKVDGDIYTIVDFMHVKPGKGGAFVRTKMKSILKGTVIDKTFRAGEKIEEIRVETCDMNYSYNDGDEYVFMDKETFEEYRLDAKFIGNLLDYIKEGDTVKILLYEDRPIAVEAPTFVTLKVTYAEPGVKGDTATNVTKPVKVETGTEIAVPLFVKEGDTIKVDTRTGDYVERVK